MDEVTLADLVAHAAHHGYSQSYVEEQLDQRWLSRGERVGLPGGGARQVYPASILRAFDVLTDAKEKQGLRGDGLRFWLWLYGARQWGEMVGGSLLGDSVRAITGTSVTFGVHQQLQKLVAYNPGGRPRKDGRTPGVAEDVVRYDKRIDEKRAHKLDNLMGDIGYRAIDEFEPLVWRLAGIPVDPAVQRKAAKLYLANASGIPPEYLDNNLNFSQDEATAYGDSNALRRLQNGEPGSWNVDKLLADATPDEWEETRRCFFLPAALLYVSFVEAIIEHSPPRPSLKRQYEFFRHPRLAIRALTIGTDVCDKVRRRHVEAKRVQRMGPQGSG